jgi:hypothetical protein
MQGLRTRQCVWHVVCDQINPLILSFYPVSAYKGQGSNLWIWVSDLSLVSVEGKGKVKGG